MSKAYGIKVVKPKVGDLDENDFARATGVSVSGQTITVTMVVNQPGQCPEGVGWKARFEPDILYLEYTPLDISFRGRLVLPVRIHC